MKTRALILFFPLAIFLAETASFPLEANSTCKKNFCMKMMKQTKCSGKTKCSKEKNDQQKPSGKCNNNSDCTICPVCLTFTFQPLYELPLKNFTFEKNYPRLNTGFVSSYIPPVWKPPNSHSFST